MRSHIPFYARAISSEVGADISLSAFGMLRTLDQVETYTQAELEAKCAAFQAFLDSRAPSDELPYLQELLKALQPFPVKTCQLCSALLPYARWLEHVGRLDESLDLLTTVVQLNKHDACAVPVAAYLQQGRVLRMSGQLQASQAAYDEAERQALYEGDVRSGFISQIGRAFTILKLGNLPAAETALYGILDAAYTDPFIQARVYHDLASIKFGLGQTNLAIPLIFQAFKLYTEPTQRMRALHDLGVCLKEAGHYSAAHEAFVYVSHQPVAAAVYYQAVLELLDISAILDDQHSFQQWRREVERQYDILSVELKLDYEIKLGSGLAAFGNRKAAVEHLERAIALAQEHKYGQRLFEAEALLQTIRAGTPRPLPVPSTPDPRLQETLNELNTLVAV